VGLAFKQVIDGGVAKSGLKDNRKGVNSLQYRENGGKMEAFNAFDCLIDCHFS